MGEYAEFTSKFFPLSAKIENEEILYQLICESNLISKIILKYINFDVGYVDETKTIFYKRFRDGINKLLLYLPLNEEIGIHACMRFSIEQLLKFVYSIYFDKSVEDINKTGYRHIKEDIKENHLIPETVKLQLQKIYTYYAKYSNDIHAKTVIENEELISLGRIIRSKNEYSGNIEIDLRKVLNVSYIIMHLIFGLKYEILNASERMSIEHLASRKRKRTIYKIFEYNI